MTTPRKRKAAEKLEQYVSTIVGTEHEAPPGWENDEISRDDQGRVLGGEVRCL